jgi:alkanesulfonate monooxygenase SsuD/methylene tetrahydromethanopterin reductase-like flavin-dependent oxidoreductase (luciferase family)
MPDYGHDIQFGYFLSPDTADAQALLETARLTDELGYDLLGVQDHPYQRRHLDALALLGVILARTERIRVFLDVGNLPLRPPAVSRKRLRPSTSSAVAASRPDSAPAGISMSPTGWARPR